MGAFYWHSGLGFPILITLLLPTSSPLFASLDFSLLLLPSSSASTMLHIIEYRVL